jgi:hypothetical protein
MNPLTQRLMRKQPIPFWLQNWSVAERAWAFATQRRLNFVNASARVTRLTAIAVVLTNLTGSSRKRQHSPRRSPLIGPNCST